MTEPKRKLSRRTLFAGVGAVGAVAATVAVLPHVVQESENAAASEPKQAPDKGGGYHLSEHVKRYYKTTLI